jgi:hypothetical protein
MNIFILHYLAAVAARMYCDKHVPKMVVELLQQLGSAVIRHGATPDMMPLTKKGTPLKGGYANHPCTLWVGDSRDNFLWAVEHAIGLCYQYTKRFGKTHFCETGIKHLQSMSSMIPEGDLTPFALAMPDEFKQEDAVEAYRAYYHSKAYFAKWEKGVDAPDWWLGMEVTA